MSLYRAVKIKEWFPSRITLHVNFLTSLLVLMSASAAAFRVPVGKIATLSAAVVALCSAGIIWHDFRRGKIALRSMLSAVPLFLSVLTLLWPIWQRHAFVSTGPDIWPYSAHGQYLQMYPRGFEGGLAIVDQWVAGHLTSTRWTTPALLALFASWLKSDVCSSSLLFAILVFCHLTCGFALFARTFGASRFLSLSAGAYGCLFGWAPEILKFGNLDQLVFMSFVPFLLVRFRLLLNRGPHRVGIVGFALCLAAITYAYPEGILICAVIFLPFFIASFLQQSKPRRCLAIILGTLIGLIIASPYLTTFWAFLRMQIDAGTEMQTAKGVFAGLLSNRVLPAFLALGEEFPTSTASAWNFILPVCIVLLVISGFAFWRRRQFGLFLCIGPLGLLCLWQGPLLRYDYGLYKVISIGWILIMPAIFVGLGKFFEQVGEPGRKIGILLVLVLLFAMTLTQELSNQVFALFYGEPPKIHPYEELTNLRKVIGDHTLRIVCDSPINQQWAVFYLRGSNIELPVRLGYLADKKNWWRLERATRPSEPATYTLFDSPSTCPVWQNSVFTICKTKPVEICGVEGPSGMERMGGKLFLWLSNQPTKIVISSRMEHQGILSFGGFIAGPSRDVDGKRTLVLQDERGIRKFDAKGNFSCDLLLRAGINSVQISCNEQPTVRSLPNGDPRTLLLGVWDIEVRPKD